MDTIKQQMKVDETAYEFEHKTSVVLMIGVNGVGKTTSVGKLAGQLKAKGKKVILAAADTFRAAAIEQQLVSRSRRSVFFISVLSVFSVRPVPRKNTKNMRVPVNLLQSWKVNLKRI